VTNQAHDGRAQLAHRERLDEELGRAEGLGSHPVQLAVLTAHDHHGKVGPDGAQIAQQVQPVTIWQVDVQAHRLEGFGVEQLLGPVRTGRGSREEPHAPEVTAQVAREQWLVIDDENSIGHRMALYVCPVRAVAISLPGWRVISKPLK
jgi:hypothetical protein